jgi:branched-chain amino acid transport system permease protein
VATATQTLSPAAPPSEKIWRPGAIGWLARLAVIAALAGAVIYVTATSSNIWAQRISLALIYAIIGLSLNVVLGYTGQLSLGHHAFVGLSAFVSAYVVTERQQSFWVGLLVAVLVGALSAGLLGLVALRIRGLYLSLITLTYGFVAVNSLFEISALTRGGAGMPAPRPALFAGNHAFAFLCMICLAAVAFVDWRLLRSKVGRAILSIKHSEAVAASYAINLTFYKVVAFVLSGAFAGLAGALFAARNSTVVATDFQFQIALLWVLMVVVGGLGSRLGVIVGSAFFALFPFLVEAIAPLDGFIEDTLERDPAEFSLVVGPLLAITTIIQFPGGIAEQLSPLTRWLAGKKFTLHAEGRKPRHTALLARAGLKKNKEAA